MRPRVKATGHGRPIKCNWCLRTFKSGGTSRVMRKILFFFCDKCWANRSTCEEHMRRVVAPALAAGNGKVVA